MLDHGDDSSKCAIVGRLKYPRVYASNTPILVCYNTRPAAWRRPTRKKQRKLIYQLLAVISRSVLWQLVCVSLIHCTEESQCENDKSQACWYVTRFAWKAFPPGSVIVHPGRSPSLSLTMNLQSDLFLPTGTHLPRQWVQLGLHPTLPGTP